MSSKSFNRRQFIDTMIAGTAALSTRALAATQFEVGGSPVIALSDGHYIMPSDFFLGTPRALRDQLGDPVKIAANTFAYRAGDRTFLFDAGAGLGDFITQNFPTASRLPADLNAAGIVAEEVTDVVITHMHPDHVGGVEAEGKPAFPNAAVNIAETEWTFWNADGFATSGPEDMLPMIRSVQKTSRAVENNVVLHSGSADLGEGVSLLPAPGHTPGHTVILLDSGNEQLMIIGDLAVHEDVHFTNPDYGWALDVDRDAAVSSRKTLLDMIATEELMIAAAHVTEPGLGHVERDGDGYRFVPL
ncbi:MAG: MBL fold metallo-hydrolase [Pseudomonadota bacterium]